MSEPSIPAKSLVSKLSEVMSAVERVPKRGRNDFHKYDYATEADIAATVRAALSERHVMLIPSIVGESRHPVGEKGSTLTVLEMEMEFLDGESGESIKKLWRGYGTDKEDKGGYKAMTGGEKYFLLKTFLMPTGDDPEQDQPDKKARGYVVEAPAPKLTRTPAPTPAAIPARVGSEREKPSELNGGAPITTLPAGVVYITKVEAGRAGGKAKGWLHTSAQLPGSDGLPMYDDRLVGLASECCQNKTPVQVLCKTSTTSGKDYVKDICRDKPTLPSIDINEDIRDNRPASLTADDISF